MFPGDLTGIFRGCYNEANYREVSLKVKCKVCRGPAFIQFKEHNANFCPEHFDQFFRRRVERAVRRYRMLAPDDRVLVAVSGGKDSLVAADVLSRLGYAVKGLHVSLGIDGNDFSEESARVCRTFFAERNLELEIYDVRARFGKSIAEAARRFPRFCAVCGMTKRHIMNAGALQSGVSALATGHNLDDLAAALFANVMRWDIRYLAKTLPALPGDHGFARKIKPLALLSEKEINAYANLHDIRVVRAVCPYSAAAKFKRYKSILDEVEAQSPGTRRSFYEGYVRISHIFQAANEEERLLGPCPVCGMPTTAKVCSFCRIWRPDEAEAASARP